MVMPIIPKALYPLVPNLAGVPALLRDGAKILDTATFGLLSKSGILDQLIGSDPVRWGVFDKSGQPVAIGDSIASFDYSNGSKVSNYPVEKGAFAAYNKVDSPYDAKITITCGGSEERRSAFIHDLDAAADSIRLFNILTPEKTYANANIERFDYRRTSSNGAGVIVAELYLIEVRETATAKFSEPKDVGALDPQAQGQIQPAVPDVPISTLTGNTQIA